jgi:predicted metal-dependent hydrolase
MIPSVDSGSPAMRFFHRLTEAELADRVEVATETGVVAVKLRRHPHARNYTLRVKGATGAPVLTIPRRGTLREARRFLDRHAGWLVREIGKLPVARPIADGALIPIRGVAHRIRHTPERRGTVSAESLDGIPTLLVSGRAEHLRRRVVDFLKREARRDLERAVMRHAATLIVIPSAIRVRDQTSRWGSCSVDGRLNFSWRLVMAPPYVLDYLAAHEVAHLREMNHSRRFWRLVEGLCPSTRQARVWLHAHGAQLHAIGAE